MGNLGGAGKDKGQESIRGVMAYTPCALPACQQALLAEGNAALSPGATGGQKNKVKLTQDVARPPGE